jgi:hypothetical protein
MGLWYYLNRHEGLTCCICEVKSVRGVVRFERGDKIGHLCHACASSGRKPVVKLNGLLPKDHGSEQTCPTVGE